MRLRIGSLIPWTLAACLLLDAGTRLIPIDLFSFRAWEALVVGRGPTGPFEPNRAYTSPLTYGDLARPQRYSGLRHHHLESFSTDAWGFRNTVSTAGARPVRWLLVGDSFGVSSGVRDGDTLASQIARLSGDRVYNASAAEPLPLNDIRFTAARVGMKQGVVVYEYMERQEPPTVAAFGGARLFSDGPPPPPGRGLGERCRAWWKNAAVSRMSILAGWGADALATALPWSGDGGDHASADLPTASYPLTNGATMLFYAVDVDVTRKADRQIPPDYLIWLQSELAEAHLQLVVLLAPTKYQVYGPLVTDANAPRPSEEPLRRLAARLAARGVLAVNTTDALRRQAAADLARHEYVYFTDDTHWNERGIAVAARALVDAWRARRR